MSLEASPLLMEKYLNAAEKVAQTAILTPEDGNKPIRIPGASMQHTVGNPYNGNGFLISTNGDVHTDYDIPRDGDYTLRIAVHDQQSDRVGAVEVPIAKVRGLPLEPGARP